MNATAKLPLCVDLDGTLIFSDALVESAVRSFFRAPVATLGALASLRKGRAAFKASMLQNGALDVATMPFNTPLIERLRSERARGRKLVLVTAANEQVAHAVQDHLELFDEVFASTDAHNLKGPAKSRFLVDRYGQGGFVYVGDAAADRAVWLAAAAAWTVGKRGLVTALHAGVTIDAQFDGAQASMRDWITALRMDQWLWNLLVFAPLAGWPTATAGPVLTKLSGAFVSCCAVASGMALFAALARLDSLGRTRTDDAHPLSAGRISLVSAGVVAFALAAIGGLAGAWLCPPLGIVMAVFVVSSALFAMVPSAPGAVSWLRRAWLVALRPLAGISVITAGLAPPVWVVLAAGAAALAAAGWWQTDRAR